MTFARYQPVSGCNNDGPGAANMLYWLDRESPWRGQGFNLGVCACRGTGAGSTSQHARCRAWDLGLPLVNGRANPIGNDIIRALIPVAGRLGLTELIWNRRRYSAKAPNGAPYTGVSPHIDHIHGAHTLAATQQLNVPTIRAVMGAGTAPSPGPAPAPAPAPDLAAVRRWTAGVVLPKLQGVPTPVVPSSAAWNIGTVQEALNVAQLANLKVDGIYSDATALHVIGFQNSCKALGLRMEDPIAVVGNWTKWWLCTNLQNIRDGK